MYLCPATPSHRPSKKQTETPITEMGLASPAFPCVHDSPNENT